MPDFAMTYALTCAAAPNVELIVLSLSGKEAISHYYDFNVVAACPLDFDLDALLTSQATLTMSCGADIAAYHGLLIAIDQIDQVGDYVLFTARLVPRVATLEHARYNQVFIEKSLPEIITGILGQRNLPNFQLRLQNQYPVREYVCQYNETFYDFLLRWMESRGLYYFFEQGEVQETLVITDSNLSALPCIAEPMIYAPAAPLTENAWRRSLSSWTVRRSVTPSGVLLKNYNYRTPNLDVSAEKAIQPEGTELPLGELYSYGEDFLSPSEATDIARVRTEELVCRRKLFSGKSFYPGLRPGYTFRLVQHFQPACNTNYLVVEVRHEGHQVDKLPADLRQASAELTDRPDYQATLTAIPASVQFRPRRVRQKPYIRGVINAVVEAEPGSTYAMLDKLGRYKVRLPFDLSGSPATKASSWMRKAEPYAGDGHGMHFPLLGGTEVLLTFLNGDIDRPIIAAAIHNAAAVSQVTDKNAAANVIRTAGNNVLALGDRKGQEYICLHSPFHNSTIALGSTVQGGDGSLSFKTEGGYESFTLGNSCTATVGASSAFTGGIKNTITAGLANSITVGASTAATLAPYDISIYRGNKITLGTSAYTLKDTNKLAGLKEVVISGGYQQALADMIGKAKLALLAGMVGAAAVAGGAELESDAFDGGALSDQGGPFYKNAYFYEGLGLAAAGVAACAAAQVAVRAMITAFDAASASAATATLKLNASGAALAVDSAINPTAEIKLMQGVLPGGLYVPGPAASQIVMSNAGQDVTINNTALGSLSMKSGASCALSVGGGTTKCTLDAAKGASIQSTMKVDLTLPLVNSITMTPENIKVSQLGGFQLTVSDEKGTLTDFSGLNGVTVTDTLTKIEHGTNAVQVTAADIQFFGGMVKISASGMVQVL